MRAILYTHDLEPITVLHLSPLQQEFMRTRSYFLVEVVDRTPPTAEPDTLCQFKTVTIEVEPLYRRNEHVGYMLFTRNEEDALLLDCTFLSGQQRELRNIRQQAYARGFLAAMM